MSLYSKRKKRNEKKKLCSSSMKQELTNTHLKLKRGTQEIANDAKKKKNP